MTAAPLLDWRDRTHWDHTRTRQCRYCPGATHLRDHRGRPAHKTCAEQALANKTRGNTR